MTLLLPPFLLTFAILLFALVNSKFAFDFHSPTSVSSTAALLWPTCTLSGIRTVHLPADPSQSVHHPLQLRVLFTPTDSTSATSSIDLFDTNSNRIGRIEFVFFLNHLQISFAGLQSPWLPLIQSTLNTVEIKDTSAIAQDIRLNGKRVAAAAFIPEFQPSSHKITYQDNLIDPVTAEDSDWIDLIQDQSLSLEGSLEWHPPVLSVERITQKEVKPPSPGNQAIDSIVYDENLSLQMASGQPLPKPPRRLSPPSRLKLKPGRVSSDSSNSASLPVLLLQFTLPIPLQSTGNQKNQILWTFISVAFIIYLGILVKLSQMTSIRKTVPTPSAEKTPTPHSTSSPSPSISASSAPLLPSTLSKSPSRSRALTVSLPNPTTLKVSVPAAFSLADNRHILFPSKLRNFQK